jgi:DNA-binding HxlR family transcriptional regulator
MGGRWKARIIWSLVQNGTLRFSEIRKACPPISDRILSLELKELAAWGLIDRTEYPVIPPKTEYRLSSTGQTLKPVMAAMAAWGLAQRDHLGDRGI